MRAASDGLTRTTSDQSLNAFRIASLVQGCVVEARQDRNCENPGRRAGGTTNRRLHHLRFAMDRHKAGAAFRGTRHTLFDGLADIVELHVEKELTSMSREIINQGLGPGRVGQPWPHFVK